MKNRFIRSVALLLIIISLCWRFYDLDRDPVPVSASLSEVLDPAGYLYNARAFVLTGDWRSQAYNHIFRIAPGFVLLAALWFKIFGLDYGRIALLSILSGFVVIACATGIAEMMGTRGGRPVPKRWAGLFALWCFAISYVFLAIQQVPKGDMESMAVCGVSALLLVSLENDSRERIRLRSYTAGLLIGLAPLVKLHAAMFAVAALLAWGLGFCVGDARWRLRWRRATPFLVAGLLCSAVAWAYWYSRTGVQSLVATTLAAPFRRAEGMPASMIASLLESNLIYRHPVELGLATMAIVVYIRNAFRSWSFLFMSLWFALGVAMFSILTYSPTRYRLLFAVPVVVLASQVWIHIASGGFSREGRSWNFVGSVFALGLFTFAEVFVARYRFRFEWSTLTVLMIAAVLTLVLAWLWRWVVFVADPEVAGGLMLAIMFLVAVPQWWRGESQRDHVYQNLAQTLAAKNPGIIPGGDIGCQLALWTHLDCSMDLTESATRPVTDLFLRESDNEINRSLIPQAFRETARFRLPGNPEPVIVLTRE